MLQSGPWLAVLFPALWVRFATGHFWGAGSSYIGQGVDPPPMATRPISGADLVARLSRCDRASLQWRFRATDCFRRDLQGSLPRLLEGAGNLGLLVRPPEDGCIPH